MKAGDTIRLKDDVGEFVVKTVSVHQIVAVDENDFEYTFLPEEVVRVDAKTILQKIDLAAQITKKDVQRANKSVPHVKNQKKNVLEIDLHATVLFGSTSGMQKHQILTEQLIRARETIETARTKKYSFVVLIHGKGTGRLRHELHQMLQGLPKIDFYDANFLDYSSGATEVFIKP